MVKKLLDTLSVPGENAGKAASNLLKERRILLENLRAALEQKEKEMGLIQHEVDRSSDYLRIERVYLASQRDVWNLLNDNFGRFFIEGSDYFRRVGRNFDVNHTYFYEEKTYMDLNAFGQELEKSNGIEGKVGLGQNFFHILAKYGFLLTVEKISIEVPEIQDRITVIFFYHIDEMGTLNILERFVKTDDKPYKGLDVLKAHMKPSEGHPDAEKAIQEFVDNKAKGLPTRSEEIGKIIDIGLFEKYED